MRTTRHSDERGIALITVMLFTVAIAALAATAIFLTSSSTYISAGHEREEDMRNFADAGIEMGRSALNGNPALFPDVGFRALAVNQTVTDANGEPYPGVVRSIYYGPTGSSTGQYGIFGSVVSVITDQSGAVVVRRGELAQESFARFAYFTDDEGSGICFGSGDQIFGPLHTNDDMCIYSSGARFRNVVEVSGTITGKSYGTFDMGYQEHGSVVPLPTIADLAELNTYATIGGMSFTTPAGGTSYQARMRIEFVSLDLDNDGRVTGSDEGFFRVYVDTGATVTSNTAYVSADVPPAGATFSLNCGDVHNGVFYTANQHRATPTWVPAGHTGGTTAGNATTRATESLSAASRRCYLGGDDHLNLTPGAVGAVGQRNTFTASDSIGRWMRYTDTPDPNVVAGLKNLASNTVDTNLVARDSLAKYLWPLSRAFNPSTKGVLYVSGRIVLSGMVNARLTLAASDDILIGDDLRYAIAPGGAPCQGSNMLGLLSPDSIRILENTINAPWNGSGTNRNYDDTNDEYLQGVGLTLRAFSVENYGGGATSGQNCQTTTSGRGCLFLTGGVIQDQRGAVGTTGGTGYIKRYAYDQCAFATPPPYFPTTGRFLRNRYYEIDPVGFDVAAFFNSLTPEP